MIKLGGTRKVGRRWRDLLAHLKDQHRFLTSVRDPEALKNLHEDLHLFAQMYGNETHGKEVIK